VRYDPENKPGVANLLSIYSSVTGESFEEIEKEFRRPRLRRLQARRGRRRGRALRPIREESERMMADKAYLESVYRDGAER
jgi:tryptophanyl-tRNA synthetase